MNWNRFTCVEYSLHLATINAVPWSPQAIHTSANVDRKFMQTKFPNDDAKSNWLNSVEKFLLQTKPKQIGPNLQSWSVELGFIFFFISREKNASIQTHWHIWYSQWIKCECFEWILKTRKKNLRWLVQCNSIGRRNPHRRFFDNWWFRQRHSF